MKKLVQAAGIIAMTAVITVIFAPSSMTGQTPVPPAPKAPLPRWSEAELVQLISEVKAQQATISANQAKAETQLATVQEAVRQARIFSAKGGGKTP